MKGLVCLVQIPLVLKRLCGKYNFFRECLIFMYPQKDHLNISEKCFITKLWQGQKFVYKAGLNRTGSLPLNGYASALPLHMKSLSLFRALVLY